jgi:Cu/Ag efflux pump CusA
MIHRIVDASLDNRVMVLAAWLLVAALGLLAPPSARGSDRAL